MQRMDLRRQCAVAVAAIMLAGSVLFAYDSIWRCYAIDCLSLPKAMHERARAVNKRARALDRHGHYEMAEYGFRKAITLHPEAASYWSNLADLMRHRGRYREAERLFLKAIALEPENGWFYIDLGKLYRNMGRYDDALSSFQKAEKLVPNHASLWSYGYSQLYKEMGLFEKGEAAGLRAIALEPEHSFHHMSLGDLYRQWALEEPSRYAEAEAAYLRALEIDRSSEAWMGLGWMYLQQGKLDESEAMFRAFNEYVGRPRGEIYMGLGIIERARGNTAAAIGHFKRAHYYDRKLGGLRESAATERRANPP